MFALVCTSRAFPGGLRSVWASLHGRDVNKRHEGAENPTLRGNRRTWGSLVRRNEGLRDGGRWGSSLQMFEEQLVIQGVSRSIRNLLGGQNNPLEQVVEKRATLRVKEKPSHERPPAPNSMLALHWFEQRLDLPWQYRECPRSLCVFHTKSMIHTFLTFTFRWNNFRQIETYFIKVTNHMFIVQLGSQTEYAYISGAWIKKENVTSDPETLATPRRAVIRTANTIDSFCLVLTFKSVKLSTVYWLLSLNLMLMGFFHIVVCSCSSFIFAPT